RRKTVSSAAAEAVFGDFTAQSIAVHPEEVGCAAEIPVSFRQHTGDEAFFELALRIRVPDASGDHLVDETIEPFAHRDHSSSRPDNRRYASTYFSRVRATTSSGKDGTGGCLFHRMRSR